MSSPGSIRSSISQYFCDELSGENTLNRDDQSTSRVTAEETEAANAINGSVLHSKDQEPLKQIILPGTEEIIERMQCNCCRLIPTPSKSLSCEAGHTICLLCFNKLPTNSCPKEDIGADEEGVCSNKILRQRSHLYSYLYYNSYHRCEYYDLGCRRMPLGVDVHGHKRLCIYSPTIPCPMSDCDLGPFSFTNYSDHLKSSHDILSLGIGEKHTIQVALDRVNKGIEVNAESYSWVCAIFPTPTIDFFLLAREYYGGISMWMTTGPPNGKNFDLDNFDYSLTVLTCQDAANPDEVIRWQGQIQPFSKKSDQSFTDGTSLTIAKPTFLKQFVFSIGQDYFWRIQVQLNQPEAEKVEPEPESKVEPEPESKVEVEPETKVETEQESKVEAEPETKVEAEPETKVEAEPESKVEPEPETKFGPELETKFEPEPETNVEPEPVTKVGQEPETRVEPEPETKVGPEPETRVEPEPEAKVEPEPETKVEPEPETKVESEPETKVESEPETKFESEPEAKVEPEPETKVEPEPETKFESEPETKFESEPETKFESEPDTKVEPEPVAEPEMIAESPSPSANPCIPGYLRRPGCKPSATSPQN